MNANRLAALINNLKELNLIFYNLLVLADSKKRRKKRPHYTQNNEDTHPPMGIVNGCLLYKGRQNLR